MTTKLKALVLCEESHMLSRELVRRGCDVACIDLKQCDNEPGIRHMTGDVLLWPVQPDTWDIVAAFPPCTEFAVSGARWWAGKSSELLEHAVKVARHCYTHVQSAKLRGLLENPVGRLSNYIGPWLFTFQPWEYGTPESKRTCWGKNISKPTPLVTALPADCKTSVHHCPPGPDRDMIRSRLTPGQVYCFAESLLPTHDPTGTGKEMK